MLYTLIISPLELLFEVIFEVANKIIGNAGLSIIFLSLAVNFLVLPLYKRADELQAEERDIQAKMAPRIKQIKSSFQGDERLPDQSLQTDLCTKEFCFPAPADPFLHRCL